MDNTIFNFVLPQRSSQDLAAGFPKMSRQPLCGTGGAPDVPGISCRYHFFEWLEKVFAFCAPNEYTAPVIVVV
ncbi:MAG: hypothetical protein LBB52_00705 [Desulfovibrio sp.]|jgi:hypothetical protein|nr:hypothetical protein [Desulfovibrio sp.]